MAGRRAPPVSPDGTYDAYDPGMPLPYPFSNGVRTLPIPSFQTPLSPCSTLAIGERKE